ncbi:MAG: N-acetylmuramoyl-L-alanine amidase [Bacteroidetes bacterium]|nr:N-acetylmuramoyl-L-alanine amidase [Bacteroidota bacterium]
MKPANKYAVIITGALLTLFVLMLVFLPETQAGAPHHSSQGLKTVVIDAGHGGHDAGCLGSSAYEKHVALAISLKLGKLIEEKFPDVKVIYTRKTDVFVELYRRAQIANENKADLFICIHCNSGPKTAFGAETYVMGLHKSQDNLNVAKRENAVILQEDNYEKQYDGFDPNSPEANIIFSLYQNAFLDQSLYFAGEIQEELTGFSKRHNRGVKQAGFLVLFKTTMPSVLIETGFLTNLEEEKYLKTEDGQKSISESVFRAFTNYKKWIDGAAVKLEQTGPVIKQEEKPVVQLEASIAEKPDVTVYRVQIFSSGIKYPSGHPVFKERKDIWMYSAGGLWKYTAGAFEKMEDAVNLQADLKAQGFSDAFVVAFRNGERISIKDARAYQP